MVILVYCNCDILDIYSHIFVLSQFWVVFVGIKFNLALYLVSDQFSAIDRNNFIDPSGAHNGGPYQP